MGGVGWTMMEDECACWACELLTEYAQSYRPPPPEALLAACCRKLRNRGATQPMWPCEHDASDWRTENWDAIVHRPSSIVHRPSSTANAARKAGLGSIKATLTRRDTRRDVDIEGDIHRRSEYGKSYATQQGIPQIRSLANRKTKSKLEIDTECVSENVNMGLFCAEPRPSWEKAMSEARPQLGLRDVDTIHKEVPTKDFNEVNETPKDIFQCSTEYTSSFTAFPNFKKRSPDIPRSTLCDDTWWFSNKDGNPEVKGHYTEYMECFKAVPEKKSTEISQERRWSKMHNSNMTVVIGEDNTPFHPAHDGLRSTMNFSSEYKEKFKGLPPLEKRAQSRPRTALREVDWKVKYVDPVSNSEWKTRRWVGGVRDGTRANESTGYNTLVSPTQRRSRLDSWEAARSAKNPVISKERSLTITREKNMTRLDKGQSTFSKTSNTAAEHIKRPPFRLLVNNQDTRDRLRGRSVSPSRLRWQMNAERENNSFVVLERTPQ